MKDVDAHIALTYAYKSNCLFYKCFLEHEEMIVALS